MACSVQGRPRKGREVKNKIKSMLIILFDIKWICSQRIRPGRPNNQFGTLLGHVASRQRSVMVASIPKSNLLKDGSANLENYGYILV
jgi:hypothetical protein